MRQGDRPRSPAFKWKPLVARMGYESGAFGITNRAWRNRLTTLTYHRVADPTSADFRGLVSNVSATPETFGAHLDLVRRWFNVISLDVLLAWLRGDGDLPPRAALITFDDGYRDNLTAALPALKARGLEAVIFVTSGKIGSTEPFWWDHAAYCIANSTRARADLPLLGPQELGDRPSRVKLTQQWCSAASRIPADDMSATLGQLGQQVDVQVTPDTFAGVYMTWDEVRHMAANGFTIGAHTANHPPLSQVSLERARREAVDSRARLKDETGQPVHAFAYPHGGSAHFGEEHERMLSEEGFSAAFSTISGPDTYASVRRQPMRIRRIHISLRDDLPRLAVKLIGAARIEALINGS